MSEGFEDFKEYAFELKTTATKNLSPSRIQDYLRIIHEHHGLAMAQTVLENVVVVSGKYLQMSVAYNIHRNKIDNVTADFEKFNSDYFKMMEIFKEITGEDFKAGKEIRALPKVAAVKPVKRADSVDPEISDKQRKELHEFLRKNNLEELSERLVRLGVTLEDVLEMNDEDMRDVGIKSFKVRKQLRVAAQEHQTPAPRLDSACLITLLAVFLTGGWPGRQRLRLGHPKKQLQGVN